MASFDLFYINREDRAIHEIDCSAIIVTGELVTIRTRYGNQHLSPADVRQMHIEPRAEVKRLDTTDGNVCKKCGARDSSAVDIRWKGVERVRRRRCQVCGAEWKTVERYYWDVPREE